MSNKQYLTENQKRPQSIRLSNKTHGRLKIIAIERGVSLCDLTNTIIDAFFDADEREREARND